jgi:hypothetical protein
MRPEPELEPAVDAHAHARRDQKGTAGWSGHVDVDEGPVHGAISGREGDCCRDRQVAVVDVGRDSLLDRPTCWRRVELDNYRGTDEVR